MRTYWQHRPWLMEKVESNRHVEVWCGADRRHEARRYSHELAARRVEQAADVLAERVGDEGDLRRREVAAGAEPVVGRAHASLSGMLSKLQYFREG